ncbi:hypothetical protein D922_03851, partial [Enterococcus faecalis 06-MB-DW-09]
QQPLKIEVTQEGFTVTNHGEQAIEFIAFDKVYLLEEQIKITF